MLVFAVFFATQFANALPIIKDTSAVVPVQISEETEKSIFSDKSFVYKEEQLKHGKNFIQDILDWFYNKQKNEERREEEQRNTDYHSSSSPGDFWSGEMMGNLLIIICVIVVVGGLAYLLISGKHKVLFAAKPLETPFDFKEITEDIEGLNIDKLIEQARLQGDYRLATRWWYLKLLKKFATQELINWKPHKTNFDYFRELENTQYIAAFRQASYVYENVWYGEMDVKEELYNRYIPQFDSLEKSVHA